MMSREEDKRKEQSLSQSTEEREFQQMLEQIAKLEAGEKVEAGPSNRPPTPEQSRAGQGQNNASGIMTEEQELQIALEQIQAAEAREAAMRADDSTSHIM
jgi:hypothetical protein